jgi:hypothetical protein
MRLYLIEDIYPEHMERIKQALDGRGLVSAIEGLYWLPVPKDMLGEEQRSHTDCGPHCLALELGKDWLRLELLVRGRSTLRCSCIAYARPELRAHMIDWLDTLLKELDVPV